MPLHEVTVSRTIAARPEDLWSVLTAVDRRPDLLRSVVRIEPLAGPQAYAPGSQWRETRSMDGREASRVMRVVEAEAPSRTVLESETDGFTHRLEHAMSQSGDHTDSRPRTLVTSSLSSEQPGADTIWLWRVLGVLGSRTTQETLAQDLADLAAAVERPETRDMLVVHRLFTRELSAGPDLVAGVPDGDRHRTAVVADHLATVLDTLVDHHHGEDVLIWPLLAERTSLDPTLSEQLRVQHVQIHAEIVEARELIAQWRVAGDGVVRDRLADLLRGLSTELRHHLESEENKILPLIEQHLTRVEYEKLAAHGRSALPRDKAAVIVQLFLEGANRGERALLLGDYPPAMQLFIRTVGARQYRRYVRRLREDR